MSGRTFLCLVLLAAALLAAACGPAPSATTPESGSTPKPRALGSLQGTEWLLTSLRGSEPLAGVKVTLGFHPDNYVEGTAGCNSFGVDYSAGGGSFKLAEIHRTRSECEAPAGIMAQDRTFFEALASIAVYRATEERLEFDDAAGETVLVYARKLPATVDAALVDTEWLLTTLLGEEPLSGSRITLNVTSEGFDGIAGCNNYGGEFEAASEGALEFGEFAVTAMECPTPEGVMEQEQAYVKALSGGRAYRQEGDRLEILDAAGETILVFERREEFEIDLAALVGTAWRLVSIDGADPGGADPGGADAGADPVTLVFYSDTVLGGYAGCRDFAASYQVDGGYLSMTFEIMFDGDCPVDEGELGLDAGVLDLMAPKAGLRLAEGRLEMHSERGRLLVWVPLPAEADFELEGTAWRLMALVGPNPYIEAPEPWIVPDGVPAESPIDLTLEGGTARGSAGCNGYSAGYEREGGSLRFGAVATTRKACLEPEGVMEREARYVEILAAVTGGRVYGERLWLETGDGRALLFYAAGR